MSSMLEIVANRGQMPLPWEEGDNIPWHEAGFSQRMLLEHLSQDHDAASRRYELIDRHVAWLHNEVLESKPTRILDLGCGPGLYSSRLAGLGHTCLGIDFSPASIEYARQQSQEAGLDCRYLLGDLRTTDYGGPFGLAMLIFGEFNVFRPEHIDRILVKINQALDLGGLLIIEPHTYDAIKRIGSASASWSASPAGLFSERPHLVLHENFWDLRYQTSTNRYYVIDAASGEMSRYAQSFQAYTNDGYAALLERHGFGRIEIFPALTGLPEPDSQDLFAIAARKEKVLPVP